MTRVGSGMTATLSLVCKVNDSVYLYDSDGNRLLDSELKKLKTIR